MLGGACCGGAGGVAVVTDRPVPLRPMLSATFRGVAAVWLWRRVEQEAREAPAALASIPGVDADAGRLLAQALSELAEAARQWTEQRRAESAVSVEGNGETALGETVSESPVVDYMGTGEASSVLGVTPRRVSQLAQAGILPGRKVGRQWMLHRPSVLDYRDAKGDAA